MPRKFINRRSDAHRDSVSAEDEWAHITNLGDEQKKLGDDQKQLDIHDVMDADRSFFINDEQQAPQTHWEKTKEATRNAMDRAGNTSQYIKYVNHHFEKQKSTINKVKEVKANYERELKLLQDGSEGDRVLFTSPNQSNKQDLLELKKVLEKEKKLTIDHLNKLKVAVMKAEDEIQKHESEIKKVEHQINHVRNQNKEEQRSNELTNEILSLGKNLKPEKLNEIIQMLEKDEKEKKRKQVV